MIIQRRSFITLLGGAAAAWPLAAHGQQGKFARIGYLGPTSYYGSSKFVEAFRTGLRELGYVEGGNLNLDFRWAEGRYERLPELAAEFVRLKVDIIVTSGTPGTRAAKQATTTIPIVMAVSGDAVATGLVASLNRPGGNITGSSFFNPELTAKRLELIKEAVPRAARIGYLFNPDNSSAPLFQMLEPAAASLKVQIFRFPVRLPQDLDDAYRAVVASGIDAVIAEEDALLNANAGANAEHAASRRLPSIGGRNLVEAGGLMGYGANLPDLFRRAATFVDKILKGAQPAELPVEQATRFEFIINQKTAKTLGIDFPLTLLVFATEVIE